MGGLPSEEFFGNLMTWSALEDAVRGLRDTTTPSAVVEKTEASNQTDPVSTARVRERQRSEQDPNAGNSRVAKCRTQKVARQLRFRVHLVVHVARFLR